MATNDETQIKLRVSIETRNRIAEAAEQNNRSMTAEINARLESSFGPKYPSDDVLALAHLLMKAANKADFAVRVMIGVKGDKFEDVEFRPKTTP